MQPPLSEWYYKDISTVKRHLDQGHYLIWYLLLGTTHLKKNGTIYLDDINNMMSKLGQVYLDYTQARINVITV